MTCDILGNPTNAPASGLSFALDADERIIQVSDGSGIVATYGYDRQGRRATKTVGQTTTRYVYDTAGNALCEYENGQWARDYVYGA